MAEYADSMSSYFILDKINTVSTGGWNLAITAIDITVIFIAQKTGKTHNIITGQCKNCYDSFMVLVKVPSKVYND